MTTKITGFKFPAWFSTELDEKLKATDTRKARNRAEIVVRAVCKYEKIKIPKGHKFVSAYPRKVK